MSQVVYRGNLSSAYFPFVSTYEGRTVIVGQSDNNFNRQLQSTADLDKDIGIPQIYYCHNVMPTGNGLESVGYEFRISGLLAVSDIFQAFQLRDDSLGLKAYFNVGVTAFHPIFDESIGYVSQVTTYYDPGTGITKPLPSDLSVNQITTAHVNGITYLYIATFGCLVWDFTNSRFTLTTLTGLSAAAILGLTESNGYLIAYSYNSVGWSSTIDPTDFVPSLQTGAGGGNVEGIKGNITCASPTSNGFIVYSSANAVAVLYTGNARYPFQFSECIGAGGVTTLERVTYEADSGYNYAYTSKGFQILRAKSAETVFADLTDFLAGQYFEDFDENTLTLIQTIILSPLKKKLNYIAARYLVISYGVLTLTHALVYDTVQKRFGKLKVNHVDCFEYDLLSEEVSDIPRKSIGFLQANGAIMTVNFSVGSNTRSGVLLLGKYQYIRSRHLQIQVAEIENANIGSNLSVYDFVSYKGKNFDDKILGTILTTEANLRTYGFNSAVGVNHSILCLGTFNLVSIQLAFNIHGRM